jgi:hypothetical protein
MHAFTPHTATISSRISYTSFDCAVTHIHNTPPALNSVCTEQFGYTLDCTLKGRNNPFINFFPTAVNRGLTTSPVNPFDEYITGGNVSYRLIEQLAPRRNLTASDEMVGKRLTTLINTYWQAGRRVGHASFARGTLHAATVSVEWVGEFA